MLTVCYSPKGGQGCTTVTAALALAQRRSRLIDTTGDLPAVLGLPETSGPGICDLLADDQTLEVAVIERLAANPSPTPLVNAGSTPATAVPEHRWSELAATLTARPARVVPRRRHQPRRRRHRGPPSAGRTQLLPRAAPRRRAPGAARRRRARHRTGPCPHRRRRGGSARGTGARRDRDRPGRRPHDRRRTSRRPPAPNPVPQPRHLDPRR